MNMPENDTVFNPARRNFLRTAPAAGLTAMAAGALPSHAAESDWLAQIMEHVTHIVEILKETAPDGTDLMGVQFRCLDGEVRPESVWATAASADNSLRAHTRPGIASPWRSNGEYL